MAESGCKCKSLSIHRPDTSGYLMYHTSNLCIIHQILCIGTISSDTSCIIHQILDVYLHLHPDERLAPNFAIHGAIHILYSDTAIQPIQLYMAIQPIGCITPPQAVLWPERVRKCFRSFMAPADGCIHSFRNFRPKSRPWRFRALSRALLHTITNAPHRRTFWVITSFHMRFRNRDLHQSE